MDHETYKQESKRTMAEDFHPDKVNPVEVLEHLAVFCHMAKTLDNDKKGLFYGRDPKPIGVFTAPVSKRFEVNELHAVLGLATEVAELIEVLMDAWENPKETDEQRIADELGDIHWYEAIIYRERVLKMANLLRGNIAKLRARFPDKFSSDQALNRNTNAEDSALSSALG